MPHRAGPSTLEENPVSRRLLAVAALGAAAIAAVPAAPASAKPCELGCTIANLVECQKVYDPVNNVVHTICPPRP